MLLIDSIPAKYQAQQMAKLLHTSEFFFPPCNGICTLMNLAVLIASYVNRDSNRAAADKLPWVGAACGLGFAVTGYTLTVMVPLNNSLKESNRKLQAAGAGEKEEKEFRQREKKWQSLNYSMYIYSTDVDIGTIADLEPVRAALMISSAAMGMTALLKDGSVIRI